MREAALKSIQVKNKDHENQQSDQDAITRPNYSTVYITISGFDYNSGLIQLVKSSQTRAKGCWSNSLKEV